MLTGGAGRLSSSFFSWAPATVCTSSTARASAIPKRRRMVYGWPYPMRGLYAIADTAALVRRGLDPVRYAAAVLEARPAAPQLRAKDLGAHATLELLRAIAPLAARHHVPLVANDRADLALLAGCAAVHVGQDDLPPREIRRFAGALRIGMSAHDDA